MSEPEKEKGGGTPKPPLTLGQIAQKAKVDAKFPKPWDVADALQNPPPEVPPLIDEILEREGSLTFLHGSGGSGKSWMALEFTVSLTTARPLGGHFAVQGKRRVMLLDLDQRGDETKRRVWERGQWMDEEEKAAFAAGFVPFSDGSFYVNDKVFRERVAEEIIRTGTEVLVIDALVRTLNGLNENEAVTADIFLQSMRELQNAVEREGRKLTIIVLHHDRKDPLDPDAKNTSKNKMRGTGAWRDGVDYQLACSLSNSGGVDKVTIETAKERSGSEAPGKKFTFRFEKKFDVFGNRTACKLVFHDSALPSKEHEALLGFLREQTQGDPAKGGTRKQIIDRMEELQIPNRPKDPKMLKRCLEMGVKRGEIACDSGGVPAPHRHQKFWSVAPEAPPEDGEAQA